MWSWRTIISRTGVGLGSVALALGLASAPASAAPDEPVTYPEGASATTYEGLGFDTCTAPSLDAMRAWTSTAPYDAVNIYFGGNNRACNQPNLTTDWIRTVNLLGWKILPTYMGHQPICMHGNKEHRYDEGNATQIGIADAQDAVAQAESLGLLPGSALYADVEHYDRSNASCRTAVLKYVSAWTTTLHDAGYLSGVYAHQDSGIRDMADHYTSSTYTRPDAVWMARWDGDPELYGWPTVDDEQWGFRQRIKQYLGDHNETWGGVTINIDSDSFEAPVATVARDYEATNSAAARSGPGTSYPVQQNHEPGATLPVVCQTTGDAVDGSEVWNQLADGSWIPDSHTSTPSETGFTAGVPGCTFPGQVTPVDGVNARTGPGTSHPIEGEALPGGGLAYVECQASGEEIGTTSVWNKLSDGRWVTDYYVATGSNTTWSPSIPRCP